MKVLDVGTKVRKLLDSCDSEFFRTAFDELVKRWQNVSMPIAFISKSENVQNKSFCSESNLLGLIVIQKKNSGNICSFSL